jgi:mitochondrial fission protein ELM1
LREGRRSVLTLCPSVVFVLSDGIRGHLSQSRGVAGWISRFTGADAVELDAPRLHGRQRFRLLKLKALFLPGADSEGAVRWLKQAGGEEILNAARKKLSEKNASAGDALFLSAGSGAAPYTLALAKALGQKCCTIMTPSVPSPAHFDFAVIPAHDHPKEASNTLVTLGAPNAIFPDELERRGWELAEKYPPGEKVAEKWALLLGGDDENYQISREWILAALPAILKAASVAGAELYITTSRRTSPDAEDELADLVKHSRAVRMLLLASRDSFNPVPGMLGLCSRVFVTEDSVSMVSEAVTAGRAVFLLRTGRKNMLKAGLQRAIALLAAARLLPKRLLWGIPRFNAVFAAMKRDGFLYEIGYDTAEDYVKRTQTPLCDGPRLNEAKRAAEWIVDRWGRSR